MNVEEEPGLSLPGRGVHAPGARRGILAISLDFELHWGMRDKVRVDGYKAHVLGVRNVVPALLDLFEVYGIHATWATVGLMFCATREELLASLPERKPAYTNPRLSPYLALDDLGEDERDDPYHYAPSLIRMIASRPHQEVGTHTFSHYYCLEPGQDSEMFKDDLRAALRVAARYGLRLRSLVFPRNQFNPRYLVACREVGITSYRGNPTSWLYQARSEEQEVLLRRGGRLVDAYINLSSHNTHPIRDMGEGVPVNVPASRFLRPWSARLRALESLRLRRIRADVTHAAKTGGMYHLWWHPENFGANPEPNIAFLTHILRHYAEMRERYGMESLNMGELADRVLGESPPGRRTSTAAPVP